MDKAKYFKRWVTKEVLPSIRKTGQYEYIHKPFKMLTFNIQSQYDLHKKVVNYIRNHHPKALLIASLGENQINNNMRLRSYNMGYQKGSPDLIIQNQHKTYSGFVIEFKTPKGNCQLLDHQKVMLQEYKNNNFKVLVSNDYDEILEEIIHYFNELRDNCNYCPRKCKSSIPLKHHLKYIHKNNIVYRYMEEILKAIEKASIPEEIDYSFICKKYGIPATHTLTTKLFPNHRNISYDIITKYPDLIDSPLTRQLSSRLGDNTYSNICDKCVDFINNLTSYQWELMGFVSVHSLWEE